MVFAVTFQSAAALALFAAVYVGLAIVFVGLGRFARRMWERGEVPQTVLARLGQLVLCGLVVASLPILAFAIAALSCPPHAWECPI
jgi:hypothetical protein